MALPDTRPVYLNLFKIRLPIPGIVSIIHRASGLLLFLVIPVCAYYLDQSVSSEVAFNHVMDLLQELPVRLMVLFVVWALVHHLFAGIRYLLIDFDIGVDRQKSIIGAWLVIAAELIVMAYLVMRFIL